MERPISERLPESPTLLRELHARTCDNRDRAWDLFYTSLCTGTAEALVRGYMNEWEYWDARARKISHKLGIAPALRMDRTNEAREWTLKKSRYPTKSVTTRSKPKEWR